MPVASKENARNPGFKCLWDNLPEGKSIILTSNSYGRTSALMCDGSWPFPNSGLFFSVSAVIAQDNPKDDKQLEKCPSLFEVLWTFWPQWSLVGVSTVCRMCQSIFLIFPGNLPLCGFLEWPQVLVLWSGWPIGHLQAASSHWGVITCRSWGLSLSDVPPYHSPVATTGISRLCLLPPASTTCLHPWGRVACRSKEVHLQRAGGTQGPHIVWGHQSGVGAACTTHNQGGPQPPRSWIVLYYEKEWREVPDLPSVDLVLSHVLLFITSQVNFQIEESFSRPLVKRNVSLRMLEHCLASLLPSLHACRTMFLSWEMLPDWKANKQKTLPSILFYIKTKPRR